MLNLIGRLPANTHYGHALSLDEEYAREMIRRGDPMPTHPSMVSWSPQVDMTARVLDAVKSLHYSFVASNVAKGKAGTPPEPATRPERVFERIKSELREDKKKRLDAMLFRTDGPSMADAVADPTGVVTVSTTPPSG